MKNSKKLLFAGTLALALSASAVLPTNVHADGEENQAQEQVQESVKLDLQFKVKNNEGNMENANSYFKNYDSIVDVNGVPHAVESNSTLWGYEAKRGTTLNFKYKKSGEVGAKPVAEGKFDVPEVGYKDYDDINILLNPVDGKEDKTEEKIEEDKKEERPQKPEEKPQENEQKPQDEPQVDEKEEKIEEEKPQVDEKEEKIEEEKPQVEEKEEKEEAPLVEDDKKDENTDEKVEENTSENDNKADKDEIVSVDLGIYTIRTKKNIKIPKEKIDAEYLRSVDFERSLEYDIIDSNGKVKNNFKGFITLNVADVEIDKNNGKAVLKLEARGESPRESYPFVKVNVFADEDSVDKTENKEEQETEKEEENKKPEDDKTSENLEEKGYKTKEEAEKAAKKALENDKINKSYSISKGQDGKYYYVLSPVEKVKADPVKKSDKDDKKETKTVKAKKDNKAKEVKNTNTSNKSTNVKTGVTSLGAVLGTLAAAAGGYIFTKKNK